MDAFIWEPKLHSDDENVLWGWLRAVEWAAYPIFLSQVIVPFMFFFLSPHWVLLVAVYANLCWNFVKYKWIIPSVLQFETGKLPITDKPVAVRSGELSRRLDELQHQFNLLRADPQRLIPKLALVSGGVRVLRWPVCLAMTVVLVLSSQYYAASIALVYPLVSGFLAALNSRSNVRLIQQRLLVLMGYEFDEEGKMAWRV